ncbi:hypothetical protein QMY54_00282 (plasmid) [Pseudomonas rhodesiae]|jgi:hypothetical protein|nr:hypothetical protein QMY54_00282 [Pseudomonas rhodesiae]
MPVISNITVRELNMGANHKQVLQSGLFGWWVGSSHLDRSKIMDRA